jgi:hypothetical protein
MFLMFYLRFCRFLPSLASTRLCITLLVLLTLLIATAMAASRLQITIRVIHRAVTHMQPVLFPLSHSPTCTYTPDSTVDQHLRGSLAIQCSYTLQVKANTLFI